MPDVSERVLCMFKPVISVHPVSITHTLAEVFVNFKNARSQQLTVSCLQEVIHEVVPQLEEGQLGVLEDVTHTRAGAQSSV